MELVEKSEGHLVLRLDASLYPEAVVFKCFYWYGDRFSVDISWEPDRTALRVSLRPLKDVPDWGPVEGDIRRSLIDFRTRQIVADETRAIRELIAAKAFSTIDPLPIEPPGDPSDPVGFAIRDFDDPEE